MEPWSWRNRLTPQSESEDSPFHFTTPIVPSSVLFTPPSSGSSVGRVSATDGGTPRSHRLSLGISSLPRELTCKCSVAERKTPNHVILPSIKEEVESSELRKRRMSTSYHFSPNKKRCLKTGTPKKFSQVLCCHHKENSPIKVDFGIGASFPFVLKPPPRKLDAPCPAHGRNYVDILGSMASMNMYRVLQQVLSYLSPVDVTRAAAVSKTWRRLIHEVSTGCSLSEARNLALTSKENFSIPDKEPTAEKPSKSENETTPLKILVVENKNPSPKRRIIFLDVSPPSKRFAHHLREGKALGKDGALTKCPKCRCPAPVIPGRASSICCECRYNFCPQCRCSAHLGQSCSFTISSSPETPPRKKQVIGSKSSKRALRRLL